MNSKDHKILEYFVGKRAVKSFLSDTNSKYERIQATLFSSDLAGYTEQTDRPLSPEDLLHLQNRYLYEYSSVLISSGAEIDDYYGSSLLAYWDHSKHENKLDVISFYDKLQIADEQLKKEYQSYGFPNFRTKNAFVTGEVLFSNTGTEFRGKYSLFGSWVSIVLRLAQGNVDYKTKILLDEETVNLNKAESKFEYLDDLRIKGSTKILRIYTIR